MALQKIHPAMLAVALADIPGDLPADRVSGLPSPRIEKSWKAIVTTDDDLTYGGAEVTGFRVTTDLITAAGVCYLTNDVDCSHRGLDAGDDYDAANMPPGSNYPVGISSAITWRKATTVGGLSGESWTDVSTGTGAGQLPSRQAHYKTVGAHDVAFAVQAGFYYQFSLRLSGHTDAGSMNGVDGAAELTTGGGSNVLRVRYVEGAVVSS